jgi:glycosyltransferase involved in cell wall biosynthesis
MSAPLVSVVMPVYNAERFVAEAMRSVLAQTFADFEFVVVDDGSSDSSAEIVRSIGDPRIVLIRHEKNAGLRAALNTGCEAARGTFVARMDADDVSLPPRFERQLSVMRADPRIGVVGSQVENIDENGRSKGVKRLPTDPALVAWSMLFFNSLVHPAVMMRRDVLASVGFYPAGCAGGTEDYALFMRMSRVTRLANVDEVLLRYRVWGSNMTNRQWQAQENDAVRIIREALQAYFGIDASPTTIKWQRGLSTDAYPESPDDLRSLGELIVTLRSAYVSRTPLDAREARAINSDAGVKLLLLAALSARRSPALASHLAARALTLSPGSAAKFAVKAGRRAFRFA